MRALYIIALAVYLLLWIILITAFTAILYTPTVEIKTAHTYQFKTHTVIKIAMERPHVRQASRGTQHREYIGMFEATAYNLTKNPTATGQRTRVSIVAVDPKTIRLGTRLYIEGYGYAVASDTGGVIKGRIIDVWLPGDKAIEWGRKQVKVWIVR